MSPSIEHLESRTLLSATATQAITVEQAVSALVTQAKQARLDVAAGTKAGAADVKAIRGDLQRLKGVAGNAALLKQFNKQEQAAEAQFKKDASAAATSVSKDTRHSVVDAVDFILSPGNAKATATLAADLTALQALTTSGPVEKLEADASADEAVISGDLNSIAATDAADAKTVADVTTAKTDLSDNSAKLQGDASALQSDLTTLIDAVEAIQTA